MSRVRVAILGSTGSIGRQALEVARQHPDRVEVVALAAHSSVTLLIEQAESFGVQAIALGEERSADEAARHLGRAVQAGAQGLEDLAGASGADLVLNALVGAAGLRASIAALDSGARLALANKESLVAGGDLLTKRGLDRILPVDSEHSAIYQCLLGEPAGAVDRIWLTASGGPFRGWKADRLAAVTVEQALAHPRWTMGPKISIDSATLMNKGLEVIEAHHLFGVGYDRIRVVVHPQSCIHSMVEFSDGSVKAHLGATDMRVPIQYAFSYPDRWDPPASPVDFLSQPPLTFEPPDLERFPSLRLAYEAGRAGGTTPAVLNAANEIAVAAFLSRRCTFTDIPACVARVLEDHESVPADSLEAVETADAWARDAATRVLS